MKTILETGIIATFLAIFAVMTMPSVVTAASIADNVPSQSNKTLSVSGTTEPSSTVSINGSNGLVLTAIPDKGIISAGDTIPIHIKATTNNGTGISDLLVQAVVMDYATGKQRVLLGGSTNEKGELDLLATIGPHAKSGQFFVAVNATKGDLKSAIATGFAVNNKGDSTSSGSGSSGSGSSSSSSSMKKDSKGRCSGSSCK